MLCNVILILFQGLSGTQQANDESQLEAMFPMETQERIAKALEIGHDLSGAVDFLLGSNGDSKFLFLLRLRVS